jgi:hypothetical protein
MSPSADTYLKGSTSSRVMRELCGFEFFDALLRATERRLRAVSTRRQVDRVVGKETEESVADANLRRGRRERTLGGNHALKRLRIGLGQRARRR